MAQRKAVETTRETPSNRTQGPSANHVNIIGRMATSAELRSTSNGIPVTTFRLAVNSKGDAQFFSVLAWGQQAEFVAKFLSAGRLVHIEGRLQARPWEAGDGSHRVAVEIVAERVQALSSKPKTSEQ